MALDTIAIKLPTFWTTSPRTWFAQAEAQFAIRNITSQETMYYHLVASLDTATANRALSILTSPPVVEQYNTLKTFLLSAFSLTDEERAMAILNMTNIGDKKPSELMDEMLALLGDHKPCFLFKHIFLSQLPDTVRIPLASSTTQDYRTLAQEADRLLIATTTNQTINAASSQQVRNNWSDQRKNRDQNKRFCSYHARFGRFARKCAQPCEYSTQKSGNGPMGQQ